MKRFFIKNSTFTFELIFITASSINWKNDSSKGRSIHFVNKLKITTTLAIVPDTWGGESCGTQSFPQVLRTWGELFKV